MIIWTDGYRWYTNQIAAVFDLLGQVWFSAVSIRGNII